jgi:hypothetical protein
MTMGSRIGFWQMICEWRHIQLLSVLFACLFQALIFLCIGRSTLWQSSTSHFFAFVFILTSDFRSSPMDWKKIRTRLDWNRLHQFELAPVAVVTSWHFLPSHHHFTLSHRFNPLHHCFLPFTKCPSALQPITTTRQNNHEMARRKGEQKIWHVYKVCHQF